MEQEDNTGAPGTSISVAARGMAETLRKRAEAKQSSPPGDLIYFATMLDRIALAADRFCGGSVESKRREQVLVDVAFMVAMTLHGSKGFDTREQAAAWVAEQLRARGFPTRPVGIKWGVLDVRGELDATKS